MVGGNGDRPAASVPETGSGWVGAIGSIDRLWLGWSYRVNRQALAGLEL